MQLPPPFVPGSKTLINVVIETPKGSRNKYAFDPDSYLFLLKKILPAGTAFPLDFGFVPGTKAEDGDPLDVLVLMEQATYPGCLLQCRPIGVIKAEQQDRKGDKPERNDRLIAVPDASADYDYVQNIRDISAHQLNDVIHFFQYYRGMSGGTFTLLETAGKKEALKMVQKNMV